MTCCTGGRVSGSREGPRAAHGGQGACVSHDKCVFLSPSSSVVHVPGVNDIQSSSSTGQNMSQIDPNNTSVKVFLGLSLCFIFNWSEFIFQLGNLLAHFTRIRDFFMCFGVSFFRLNVNRVSLSPPPFILSPSPVSFASTWPSRVSRLEPGLIWRTQHRSTVRTLKI